MAMASTEIMISEEDFNKELETTPMNQELKSDKPFDGILSPEQYLIFRYTLPAFYILLTLTGITTNIANVYGFVKLGVKDSVSVTMLFLSLSDLTLSITQLGNSVASVVELIEETSQLLFPVDPFLLIYFCGGVGIHCYTTTTLITTYLALTRCMCVVQPLRFKSMFTFKRTLAFLIAFVVFPYVTYIPVYVETGTALAFNPRHNITRPTVWVSPRKGLIQNSIVFINNLVIPITCQVIVFASVVFIVAGLKSTSAFRNSLNSEATSKRRQPTAFWTWKKPSATSPRKQDEMINDSRDIPETSAKSHKDSKLRGKELRVARQVILISVVFIFTNIPALLRSSGRVAVKEFGNGKRYNNIYQVACNLIVLASLLNACTTLFIYLKFNTAFRKVLSCKKN